MTFKSEDAARVALDAFLAAFYPGEGASTVWANFAPGWSGKGVRVEIYCATSRAFLTYV